MTTDPSPVAVTAATRTRPLLALGVIAGPFFFIVGILLGLTRPGFDLAEHQLSLLLLGEGGWMQLANFLLSGLMVVLATIGLRSRARETGRGTAPAVLIGVFGLGIIGSGLFPPDPLAGFPPGAESEGSVGGILHLVFGMVQFVALGIAAFIAARFDAKQGARRWFIYGLVTGIAILLGFIVSAAFSQVFLGLALLWLTVAICFAWIAAQCVRFARPAD